MKTALDQTADAELLAALPDPIDRLLLTGRAETVREAEEIYLDACLPEVVSLLNSPLSDDELGRHPLMVMLRSHGSRPWEESIE
jgi:hypothetical protein